MTQLGSNGDRLAITPALDAGDVEFLAGFSRPAASARGHRERPSPARVALIWPGQPAVPSPWAPCESGCCLVLISTRSGPDAAGQWLRFLVTEFLAASHRVDGWVQVPGPLGRCSSVLMVDAGDVFEGELDEGFG